jgi:hypothetical protein
VRTYASVCTLIHATAGTDRGERGREKDGDERGKERGEEGTERG